jgi:putative two-component system response regulator
MSSDPRNASRSPAPERAVRAPPDEAAEAHRRGEPLLEALERHLPGAREHAEATAAYSFAAAVELGLSRERCELTREVARLHEVGKVYLPADLLSKPASDLCKDERARVAAHPASGYELALGSGVPERACVWIRQVGERFDGGGPAALSDGEIPLAPRIIRAACAYHELLTRLGSSHKPSDRRSIALSGLRERAGRELDPDLVEAIARVVMRAMGR